MPLIPENKLLRCIELGLLRELTLDELKGKTLGCWCKPECCHGDVLINLLKKMKSIM